MTTVQGRTISMLKSKHHTKEVRPLRPRPVVFNTQSNSITWCSETITILKIFLREVRNYFRKYSAVVWVLKNQGK